ncbi:MAG: hypothetical protein R3D28_24100 [Geminicoccaceae bacterium]
MARTPRPRRSRHARDRPYRPGGRERPPAVTLAGGRRDDAGEAASGLTRADHELVSDVEAMLDPSDGDLLDVSAGYVSARSAERVRRMTGLDTYDLNLRVNKRTARKSATAAVRAPRPGSGARSPSRPRTIST